MSQNEFLHLCRDYDTENDLEKKHLLGMKLDDAASKMSERSLKEAIRILTPKLEK